MNISPGMRSGGSRAKGPSKGGWGLVSRYSGSIQIKVAFLLMIVLIVFLHVWSASWMQASRSSRAINAGEQDLQGDADAEVEAPDCPEGSACVQINTANSQLGVGMALGLSLTCRALQEMGPELLVDPSFEVFQQAHSKEHAHSAAQGKAHAAAAEHAHIPWDSWPSSLQALSHESLLPALPTRGGRKHKAAPSWTVGSNVRAQAEAVEPAEAAGNKQGAAGKKGQEQVVLSLQVNGPERGDSMLPM